MHAPRFASRSFRSRSLEQRLLSGSRPAFRTLRTAPESMGVGFGNFAARNRLRPTNPGRGNRTRTNSGGGRARSHHRLRPRHRRHGRLHHPRPDLARRAPAHDLGTGGLDRLPRPPDRGHRADGPRHAGTDRRRPGAEDQGRHQRPRAQVEESVHPPGTQLARGRHCPGRAGHAVGCRRRARQPRSRPPPLRGLRRALRHKLPARPRRRQPRLVRRCSRSSWPVSGSRRRTWMSSHCTSTWRPIQPGGAE